MAYIGKQPTVGNFVVLDSITTSATDTFALTSASVAYSPASANHCIVSLNGVIQAPISSFTISGSNIVFASALTATDVIDFIQVLGDVLNVGTPTDGTVTTAKIADGAITGAKLASGVGGKVLQVVSTTKTDTFTGTNLTSFTDITGMSVDITPSSASSKIFILYTLNYGVSGTGLRAFIKLLRDATAVGVGDTAGSRLSVNSYMNNSMISATTSVVNSFLDSPSTTSSVTYKLQISSEASGFNQYINRSDQDLDNSTYARTASTITAIEIGA